MKTNYQNKKVTGDQEITKSKSQQRREAEMQQVTADGTVIEKLKGGKLLFNFPSLGRTVEAETYEEALSIINKEK